MPQGAIAVVGDELVVGEGVAVEAGEMLDANRIND